ncbi:hypothetical protein ACIPWL_03685 [Streptomyces sp. NPDC090023]|uniref:hypothetical protein n=1 Tax=unclassified Streptomyces TaxID=2593676 RepID=UPI00382FABFC
MISSSSRVGVRAADGDQGGLQVRRPLRERDEGDLGDMEATEALGSQRPEWLLVA